MNRTEPRRTPAVFWTGLLCALALLAAGVVLVQSFVADRGWVQHGSWVRRAAQQFDGLRADSATAATIGGLALVLGLLLLITALRPAGRSHRPAGDGLWASPAAIAAIAGDAAERCAGVVGAETSVGRREIRLEVRVADGGRDAGSPAGQADATQAAVAAAVHDRLGDLVTTPVRVQVRQTRP